ncbi:hypothetical protein BDY24DRAFT_103858 [Mrakia frigida]|uniref:uncharacterized protein n=1 Tax=Mrakia frigida TaxID=29902 RepID=UPI003FCC1475
MYFSTRPYSDSEPADNLPSTTLVRVHRALYGGKGSDHHLSSVPTEDDIKQTVDACYELDSVYENPLFSFYDRPAITQAFLLSRFVSTSRLPLPSQVCRSAVSSLGSLLGLSRSRSKDEKSWKGWEIATVWSEFGDTTESDSFDGSHLGILSHTLHISFLPSLPLIGNHTQIRLRTLTLLQFNEGGLITFHRDHWDVRDLIEGIIPFASSFGAVARWGAGWGARLVGASVGALSFEEVVNKVMLERETEEVRRVIREEVRGVAERVVGGGGVSTPGSPKVGTTTSRSTTPGAAATANLATPGGPGGISTVAFPGPARGSTTSLFSNASTSSPQSPNSSYLLRPPAAGTNPTPLTSPINTSGGRLTRRRKTISRPWGSGSYASNSSLAEMLDQEEEREREGNALGLMSHEGDGLMGSAPDVDEGEEREREW